MIPIVVFALFGQSTNTYVESVTLGTLFRLLVIIYFIKLSRSIQGKSRILGGRVLLHIFIIFFLALVILSYFFYYAERSAPNSQITNLGDALWWTLQTASTSTFGPKSVTAEGRIVMLVGIGITITFISTLAAGLTRPRIKEASAENNPKLILKIRLAKGEITKESYSELLKLLSE